MDIDKTQPVLVTGATGYVAGHLIKRLLAEGLTVHAAVRDPENSDKLKYLTALAEQSEGTIRYFKTDLLDAGSYAEAMADCQVVFHTASPFKISVKDPLKDLLEPAKLGTQNVLNTVNQTPSVRRVVLTSSCAAIYCDNADLDDIPADSFTEAHWNSRASLTHQPYAYSKVIAEKAAWKMYAEQDPMQNPWDLVVINPSFILGAAINPHATSESFSLIKEIGSGKMKWGTTRYGFGAIDVRDVAEAHVRAAFIPQAKGRYLTSAENTDLFALTQLLIPKYGDRYPIPRRVLPKCLAYFIGPFVDERVTKKIVCRNIGKPWKGDNNKVKQDLGMTFRSLDSSLNEMFQQLIDSGRV